MLLSNLTDQPHHNHLFVKKLLIPLVYLLRYGINVGKLKGLQDGPQIGAENQRGVFVIVIVDVKETWCLNDTARNRHLGTDRLERRSPRVMTHVISHTSNILNDEILDCQASAPLHVTNCKDLIKKIDSAPRSTSSLQVRHTKWSYT